MAERLEDYLHGVAADQSIKIRSGWASSCLRNVLIKYTCSKLKAVLIKLNPLNKESKESPLMVELL